MAPSLLGAATWRLAAALLYGCSLLLVSHDLPAAVFCLTAAIVCLPGARADLRERTGIHVRGAVAASTTVVLLLCAVVRAGLPAEDPISSASAAAAVGVSISLAGKP
jgi:hypothetical protein